MPSAVQGAFGAGAHERLQGVDGHGGAVFAGEEGGKLAGAFGIVGVFLDLAHVVGKFFGPLALAQAQSGLKADNLARPPLLVRDVRDDEVRHPGVQDRGRRPRPTVVDDHRGEAEKLIGTLSEDETARARAQLKANILMARESTSARAEQLARHLMLFDRPLDVAELVEKIDAVDDAAVKAVAERLFKGTPTLAAIGPVSNVEAFDTLAARFA